MILAIAVGITDAAITFLGWQRLDSWLTGSRLRVLGWDAALTVAIGVNTMGYVRGGWEMLIPSIVGSGMGTLAAFRWKIL